MATRSARNNRVFLPPPRGVDFRLPIATLPDDISPFMLNYHYENGRLRKRNAHTIGHTVGSSTNEETPIIVPYLKQDEIQEIVVGSVTTEDGTNSSSTASVISVPTHDYVIWKNKIHFAAHQTTSQLDPTNLNYSSGLTYTAQTSANERKGIGVYRERLYIGDGQVLYYSASGGNVAGAASSFGLQNIIDGNIEAIESFSLGTGYSLDVYLVIVTNFGEVLIYQGANPGAADWALVQSFRVPVPVLDPAHTGVYGTDQLFSVETFVIPNDVVISMRYGYQMYSVRELLTTGNSSQYTLAEPLKLLWATGYGTKSAAYYSEKNAICVVAMMQASTFKNTYLNDWVGSGLTEPPEISSYAFTATNYCYVCFLLDLDDGHIEMHSIDNLEGIYGQLKSANEYIAIGSTEIFGPTVSDAFPIRLFDKTASPAFQDYGDTAITAIAGFTLPMSVGYRLKKINNMILYSNLTSSNSFSWGINKDFYTGPPASFADKATANTINRVASIGIGGVESTNAPVIILREDSTHTTAFEIQGLDVLYEEGGEF